MVPVNEVGPGELLGNRSPTADPDTAAISSLQTGDQIFGGLIGKYDFIRRLFRAMSDHIGGKPVVHPIVGGEFRYQLAIGGGS